MTLNVKNAGYKIWRRSLGVLLAAWALAAPVQAQATGISQLNSFMHKVSEGAGHFEQTVYAASGRVPQQASGEFVFSRPGKFRWHYQQPYAQLLVSDGRQLWSWDEDLNQVTIQTLGEALGNTPAAVIAGTGDLSDTFVLEEEGVADQLAWVLATPRQADGMFSRIRLGFSDGVLRKMEMHDNFGQRTEIEFVNFRTDVQPSATDFQFSVPAGADVLGG